MIIRYSKTDAAAKNKGPTGSRFRTSTPNVDRRFRTHAWERKKIKAILCNNIEKNQFIDSVFSLNNIPWCFSKLPLIISNYNHNHKTQYGGAGAWGMM